MNEVFIYLFIFNLPHRGLALAYSHCNWAFELATGVYFRTTGEGLKYPSL